MSERTHFVYRIFDEFDHLLYVGCTKAPEARWRQHRAEKKPWLTFMERTHMMGPFDRATAFAKERETIEAEQPYYNSLSEHRRIAGANWREKKRRLAVLRHDRPEIFGGDFDSPTFATFRAEHDRINADVDRLIPLIDNAWRHANYLSQRRLQVVRPA